MVHTMTNQQSNCLQFQIFKLIWSGLAMSNQAQTGLVQDDDSFTVHNLIGVNSILLDDDWRPIILQDKGRICESVNYTD